MGSHDHRECKHAGTPVSRMQRTLDALLAVMSADLLVNLGVLLTSVVLMASDLGWFHPGDHGEPQKVVVVHQTSHN